LAPWHPTLKYLPLEDGYFSIFLQLLIEASANRGLRMYRLSLGVTTKMEAETTDWISRNVEALGLDGVWIGEDIGAGQDTAVLAAAMLLRSQRVRIGTGIIPIAVHSIAAIARDSVTLQEIGKGRFVLGIGIGGIQDLQKEGVSLRKPVTEMENAAVILRSLWEGKRVTLKSDLFYMSEYSLRLQQPLSIPLFLGVRGPQMLELAGRVADGVILSGPFDYVKKATAIIEKATLRAGREISEMEVVIWIPTIPTFCGIKEKAAKRIVALVVADTPLSVAAMLKIDQEKLAKIREKVASSGAKAGAEFVDKEILDAFSISGSKEHMVDQFEEFSRIGVTEVVLGPPFAGSWKLALAEIAQEVRERGQ
jgi:5,10-methylenetetrahydromethanopterin reductase